MRWCRHVFFLQDPRKINYFESQNSVAVTFNYFPFPWCFQTSWFQLGLWSKTQTPYAQKLFWWNIWPETGNARYPKGQPCPLSKYPAQHCRDKRSCLSSTQIKEAVERPAWKHPCEMKGMVMAVFPASLLHKYVTLQSVPEPLPH